MGFTFNGIRKDFVIIGRDWVMPGWGEVERKVINIDGRPGGVTTQFNERERRFSVPIVLPSSTFEQKERYVEELAEWLIHDKPLPLVFDKYPNRTLYAEIEGTFEFSQFTEHSEGFITFVCADPYKYGSEKHINFTSDAVVIENNGTAEADPIFELTATEKSTFAMISNGEQYNLIGQTVDVDEQLVDEKTLIFDERGDTLSNWITSGTSVDGDVTGTMTTDGTGIVVNNYGSGNKWHGPALLKEIAPIQDFEIEMRLRVEATNPNQTYRIEFYLFDENMQVLGKMAIMDASQGRIQYSAEGRIGSFIGKHKNYLISSQNYERNRNHFHGMLRMRRIGKRFEFYVARIGHNEQGFIHHDFLDIPFNDINNEYQGKLKYVQIHIGKYGSTSNPPTPRINLIKVSELNEVLVDQTPYIFGVGDIVTFDHKNDDILVNGEARNDLKNFGGSFFKLQKGENVITVTPEDSFDSEIKFRERYR